MGLYLRRNSWTVIADFNDNIAIFTVNAEPQFSLTAHRVDSVLDNVGPDLIQFIAYDIHNERRRLIRAAA